MTGFFDGKGYHHYHDVGEFLDDVLTAKYKNWRIFAHFGGRFDVHFIFDWIRKNRPELKWDVVCSGSAVISFAIRHPSIKGLKWKFCDSYRLIPGSLKKLTDEFDVPHKKLDADFLSIEYNRHDCLGLYEVLKLFFDQFDICSETIASHAMRVFRTYFFNLGYGTYKNKDGKEKRSGIHIPRKEIEDFVRLSYVGGRCEVYRYDKARLNHYDVNSLYPRAMLEPVPINYSHVSRRLPDNEREIGFYDATVYVPEMYLPPLPYFSERLIFPTGKIRGNWSSIELQGALDRGCKILRIHHGRIFSADLLLKEYAEALFALKLSADKEGKGAVRHTAKILLNSLYGKFAQARERKMYVNRDPADGRRVWPIPKSPDILLVETYSNSAHILPHIAAAITSRSRMIQLKLLEEANGAGKNGLWYTDTDSVFTNKVLPVGSKIGELKQEGAGVFEAYGPKEYLFDGAYKVKGVPRSEAESKIKKAEEDIELAKHFLRGEPVNTLAIPGFRESIRIGKDTVRRVNRTKQRHARTEKRVRVGNDTRPWDIAEFMRING